jgi:hypothetical protein
VEVRINSTAILAKIHKNMQKIGCISQDNFLLPAHGAVDMPRREQVTGFILFNKIMDCCSV